MIWRWFHYKKKVYILKKNADQNFELIKIWMVFKVMNKKVLPIRKKVKAEWKRPVKLIDDGINVRLISS